MAAPVAAPDAAPVNSCCAEIRKKYAKLSESRQVLREAVKLFEKERNHLLAKNEEFKKDCDEERKRAELEKEAKVKESCVRQELEKELNDLKAELSSYQQNAVSKCPSEDVKILEARILEYEAEKNMLRELLEKEKRRCDFEKNKAEVEKEKAAVSKCSSEDVKLLEARILEAEAEKNKLRELLEKEKRRSESEKKKAKVEKEKAAEANKLLAMEKSKAEGDQRLVETEKKNSEVCRHALEKLKSEAKEFREKLIVEKSKADEAVEKLKSEVKELRDKLIVEKSKANDAIKKVALERQRTQKEKICADSERKKAQEQLKLLDLERKKAVDEKLKLDCLSQQLEEEKQKTEELKKKLEESIPSQLDQVHIKFLSEQLKLVKRHAKSAKREARLEKLKKAFSCQQVNFAKEEFLQLSNRLNIVAGSLTCGCEGKEGMPKIGESSELLGFKSKNEVSHIKKCDFMSKSYLEPIKSYCNAASNYSGSSKERPGSHLSGGSCTRPISGINSELESPIRDSVRKKSKSSAVCSTTTPFSDRTFMGSQGMKDLLTTRSTEFTGNSSKCKSSIHQTACEGGKTRQIENVGVVPENIDKNMDIEGRVPSCRKKRRINETLDSIAWLFPGDKQLLLKLDEKLSVLRGTFSNENCLGTAGTSCSCEIYGGSETGRVVLTEETDDLCKRNNKHARCSQEHTQQRIDWGRSSQSDYQQQKRRHREPCFFPDPTACQTRMQDDANGQMVELDTERGLLTEKIEDLYKRSYKHVEGSEERRQQKLDCRHLSRSDNQQQASIHDSKGIRRSCSLAETTACLIRMQEDTSVQMEESHDAVSREQQVALICFENLSGEDYLKLLDMDNDDDERRYRAAMEAPLSPTLPEICAPRFQCRKDESPYLVARLSRSKFLADESVSSCALDLIGLEIEANREKNTAYNKDIISCNNRNFIHASEEPKSTDLSTSHTDMNQNYVMGAIEHSSYPIDSKFVDVDQMPDAVTQLPISTIRKSEHRIRGSDAHEKTPINCLETVEQMPSTIKMSECRGRGSGAIEKNPKYYVIFSNTKEESISRIIHARNALACQNFVDEADSVVAEMLHFLNLKPDLLPEEKVSIFFSLLMHSISGTSLNSGSVRSGDILQMSEYVAEKTNRVIAIGKTCWSSQKFCWLDILINLIEDFLIGRKVVMYDETQSESSYSYVSSCIFVCLKEGDALFLYKDASDNQLVAASAILACICASGNHIDFLLEASYKILRRYSSDTSVVVLHAFAYAAGDQFFSLNNYSFLLAAIKSVVSLLEKGNRSQSSAYLNLHSSSDTGFHPCEHCPFDIDATSEEKCIAMLLDVLQDFSSGLRRVSSADTVPAFIVSVGESTVREYESDGFKIDCGPSCTLLRYGEVIDQPGCIPERSLCHYTDIVSLVELVGRNASWEWTYSNIIPRLLAMLESCASEEFSAALFVLIGQLARSEVDAGGYQQSGIVELRSRLSIFLEAFVAGKGIFPTQVAAVGALVNLLPMSFGQIVDGHVDHSVSSYQSSHLKLIKRWFLQLSEELQSLASSLFRSTDVHKF